MSAKDITLHRVVYGKPIEGPDRNGPIVAGSDHRFTTISKDFPSGLLKRLRPAAIFERWHSVAHTVAPACGQTGAFLTGIVRGKGSPRYIAARLVARPEGGIYALDRTYTHFAALAMRVEDCGPGTVLTLFDLLFDDERGGMGMPTLASEMEAEPHAPIALSPTQYKTALEGETSSFWSFVAPNHHNEEARVECADKDRKITPEAFRSLLLDLEHLCHETGPPLWLLPLLWGVEAKSTLRNVPSTLRIVARGDSLEAQGVPVSKLLSLMPAALEDEMFEDGWFTGRSPAAQQIEETNAPTEPQVRTSSPPASQLQPAPNQSDRAKTRAIPGCDGSPNDHALVPQLQATIAAGTVAEPDAQYATYGASEADLAAGNSQESLPKQPFGGIVLPGHPLPSPTSASNEPSDTPSFGGGLEEVTAVFQAVPMQTRGYAERTGKTDRKPAQPPNSGTSAKCLSDDISTSSSFSRADPKAVSNLAVTDVQKTPTSKTENNQKHYWRIIWIFRVDSICKHYLVHRNVDEARAGLAIEFSKLPSKTGSPTPAIMMATLAMAKQRTSSTLFVRWETALSDIVTPAWLAQEFADHFGQDLSFEARREALEISYVGALSLKKSRDRGERITPSLLVPMDGHGVAAFSNALPHANEQDLRLFEDCVTKFLVADPSAMMLPLAYSELTWDGFASMTRDLDDYVVNRYIGL